MRAAVVLDRDVPDTRREAAVDVEVEARDAAVPSRLRSLARPVTEDAVKHVERLAHLLRVRVRAEVPDTAPVAFPREHHTRVLVLDRDGDVRERLVVAQPDVERRPVALDEVLLEMQRLDLAARDDDLDVGDALAAARESGRGRRLSSGSTSARAAAATSPSRRRGRRRRRRGRGRRPASRAAALAGFRARAAISATLPERYAGTGAGSAAASTTRSPSLYTRSIRLGSSVKSSASPATTTRSARLPGSSVPSSRFETHQLGRGLCRRDEDVGRAHPERSMSSSSSRFVPCGRRPRRFPSRSSRRPRPRGGSSRGAPRRRRSP